MFLTSEPYQGDEALAGLLKKHKCYVDLAGLKALIEGVVAAPEAELAEDWVNLVAPEPTPAIKGQLMAYRAQVAAASAKPKGAGGSIKDRLAALRKELGTQKLAGVLIPRADEHQGEYVPKRADRLAWISNFTGSAGLVVVLKDKAAIFVDGRYTIQVREQVDESLFEIRHLINQPPEEWIEANLPKGGRFGFDPWLLSVDPASR